MYSKVPVQRQGSSFRSSPYASSQTKRDDPVQQAALEQLLRTIAERAANMDTKDILTLSAAFAAATSSTSSAGSVPASASTSVRGIGLVSEEPMFQDVDGNVIETGHECVEYLAGDVDVLNADGTTEYATAETLQTSRDETLPSLNEVIGGLKTVKVSARTNVKLVAGAVSKTLRSSEALVATAVGPEGINHSIKAFSITRCYLAAEGLDLTATVTEVQRDEGINVGRCYAFTVMRMVVPAKTGPLCAAGVGRTEPSARFVRPEGQQNDMKVSGSGQTAPVAGAIAKSLREDKEVIVTAVGPAAVAKTIEALALARTYVRTDGLEVVFYPEFQTIIMQGVGPGAGEQRSCVKIHAWPETAA